MTSTSRSCGFVYLPYTVSLLRLKITFAHSLVIDSARPDQGAPPPTLQPRTPPPALLPRSSSSSTRICSRPTRARFRTGRRSRSSTAAAATLAGSAGSAPAAGGDARLVPERGRERSSC